MRDFEPRVRKQLCAERERPVFEGDQCFSGRLEGETKTFRKLNTHLSNCLQKVRVERDLHAPRLHEGDRDVVRLLRGHFGVDRIKSILCIS